MLLREMKLQYVAKRVPIKLRKILDSSLVDSLAREIYKIDQNDLAYRECMYAIYVDRRNYPVGWKCISVGGVSGTVADPKVVFMGAIACGCSSLILVHNHPSNRCSPSSADIKLTQRIKEAATLLDMALLDHVIIGPEPTALFSFADEAMI